MNHGMAKNHDGEYPRRPMRIGIIAPPWVPIPPPAYGGIERVIDITARGLAAAGHDVLLYATGDSTCPVPKAWIYETACTPIGSCPSEVRHVIHAYEAMRAWGADIVHDHSLVGPLQAARFPELTVVTTNHGPFTEPELGDLYGYVGHDVRVLAISEHQAASAVPLEIPVAGVIHHGIDPLDFPMGTGKGDYVAFLGRMVPDKGVGQAVQLCRAAGVPLRIGAKMREQHEFEYFRKVVEPMLGRDIEYLGELGHDDKVALLQDAKALVNPLQWHEPFGMVMIESMSCGTPVIAYRKGAAPEIIDQGITGVICDTPGEFVDALQRIDDLDRDACRARVENYFSMQRSADEHIAFYREVIKTRKMRDAIDLRNPAPSAVPPNLTTMPQVASALNGALPSRKTSRSEGSPVT